MTTSRIILASAGTGKTYALTLHALGLMCKGADPGTILATTFTRKAAGEILDRLLRRLVDGADSREGASALTADLAVPVSTEACATMLGRVLRSSQRPEVSTIDAFFARVARSHSVELGIDLAWRIADDDEDAALRDEAISDALNHPDPAATLVLLDMLAGRESRSVRDELRQAVADAYAVFLQTLAAPRLWLAVGPHNRPLDRSGIANATRAARSAPPAVKINGEPHHGWLRAIDQLIIAIESEDWEAIARRGPTSAILAGAEPARYCGHPITPAQRKALEPIAEHARTMLLSRHRGRTLALRALLERFHSAYEQRKLESGMLVFDDVPRLLSDVLGTGRLNHLYFRLDTRLHHVLLDEFQDTSRAQFNLLEPILDELVSGSQGRSIFVVGDAKQSLYGWRNAAPELLEALPSRWPHLRSDALSGSWRSSPVVLEAVNTVFELLGADAALAGQPGVEDWASRFSTHIARHKAPLAGEASLRVVPDHPDGPVEASVLAAADLAAARTRQAPWASVAILLRRNTLIPAFLHALHQRGIRAAGEGGSQITDSPAVAVALSLIQLSEHPGDSAAAYHVTESPLGPSFGLLNPSDPAQRVRVASDVRRSIVTSGYRRFLESVGRRMASAMDARDAIRFDQLVDLASRFDQRPAPRSDAFRRFVLAARVEMPDDAKVRVMTIHAAKGLDFHCVILPELGGAIGPRGTEVCLLRPTPLAAPDAAVLSISRDLAPLHPDLQRAEHERRRREIEQELCGLYVGMTRAIHALDLLIAKRQRGDPKLSWAAILHTALAPGVDPAPGTTPWSRVIGDWTTSGSIAPPSPPPVEVIPRLISPSAGSVARAWLTPPSRSGSRPVPLAPLFDPTFEGHRNKGLALHAWLETIEWLEDWAADADFLLESTRRIGIEPENVRQNLDSLLASLHNPSSSLANALRRSRYAGWKGLLTVYREWPFAMIDSPRPDGDSGLVSGRIDRLVVARDQDRALQAEVIDFKSGGSASEAQSEHANQLGAYRRAVAAAFDLPESRVQTTVVLVGSDQVLTLPSDHVNNGGP
ncbi:MAG: UvrD-helicase domain-containing protein [Phycisphaeraceae bacterium]|nr:UvrD-helicase domain-containing protein [Phycisphaeraceae bacterium]